MNRCHLPALLALIVCGVAWPETPWALVQDGQAVRIYTREVPGEDIKELKAVMEMRTTVDKLVANYMDGDNHFKWFPKCISSRVVKRIGDSKIQFYRRIDNPWPVEDRDYVLEAELIRDPKTGEASIQAHDVQDAVPENPRAVRMKKMVEQWSFIPLDGGQVQATYLLQFDPGGSTPSSFINMALSKIGRDVFDGMYRYVQTPR